MKSEATKTEYAQKMLPQAFKRVRANTAVIKDKCVIVAIFDAEDAFRKNNIESAIGHLERFHSMSTHRSYLYSVGQYVKEIIDEYNHFEQRREAERRYEREEARKDKEIKIKEREPYLALASIILSIFGAWLNNRGDYQIKAMSFSIVASIIVVVGFINKDDFIRLFRQVLNIGRKQ